MISKERRKELDKLSELIVGTHGPFPNEFKTREEENYFWDQTVFVGVDSCDSCGYFHYTDDLYNGICGECEEADGDS